MTATQTRDPIGVRHSGAERPTMSVMHITPGLMYSGGQRVALDLIRSQKNCAWLKPTLCVLGSTDRRVSDLAQHAVDYGGAYNRPSDLARAIQGLRKVLQTARPDVVHTHSWDSSFIAGLALWGSDVAHVVHWHTTDPWLKSTALKHRIRRSFTRHFLGRQRTAMLAVSDAVAKWVCDALSWPRSAVRTVRNGIDLATFDTPSHCEDRKVLTIGCAARLCPTKGLDVLIDAFAKTCQSHAVCLKIAGEGSEQAALQLRAEDLGVSDRIEFVGHQKDVVRFYQSLDLFVLPSLSTEGLPLVLLEAMACGCPVVATAVGGSVEIFDNPKQGLLVSPGDVWALAKAMDSIVASKDLRACMTQAGRRRVEQAFDVGRMGDEVMDQYREFVV